MPKLHSVSNWKKLFVEDADLAKTVAHVFVDSSVNVAASGERSVAAIT